MILRVRAWLLVWVCATALSVQWSLASAPGAAGAVRSSSPQLRVSATIGDGLALATSSRARGNRGPAILILAPRAGKLVKTATRVRVTLRLWTANLASLGFALNRKDIPINRREVRIYRARGGFIWSGLLTRVRLSSGKNTLVASIRNRRGVRDGHSHLHGSQVVGWLLRPRRDRHYGG